MEKLISIIIPVYNVEDYLRKCIDSIIAQTYKNIEILLIDDGSTDKSGDIIEEYALLDTRIKSFSKKNGGLSDARNYGLKRVSGDLVFYLDSDDWLEAECLEQLYTIKMSNNADIVQCRHYYDYEDYYLEHTDCLLDTGKCEVYHKTELLSLLLDRKLDNFAWGKLIEAKLAKSISFPSGKYYEDIFWFYQILDRCKKYIVVNKSLVHYRQRKSSISGAFATKNLDLIEGEIKRCHYIVGMYPNMKKSVSDSFYQSIIVIASNIFIYKKKKMYKSLKIHVLANQQLLVGSKKSIATFMVRNWLLFKISSLVHVLYSRLLSKFSKKSYARFERQLNEI